MATFTLKGVGFMELPDDAIAVPMSDNDNPLENRNVTSGGSVMRIVERTATTITFSAAFDVNHGVISIGAILSGDRSDVYWQNNTRPIPE